MNSPIIEPSDDPSRDQSGDPPRDPPRAPRCLDLGCGTDKLPGAIGIDENPRSHADIIHDLGVLPWPLESDSFEYVRAYDVLEHVPDFGRCMDELHRVCRAGAVIHVRMPFMNGIHYATDPTHRRAGTSRTFDYFDSRKELGRYRYSASNFEVLSVHYERGHTASPVGRAFATLDKLLLPFIEKHMLDYELYFTGLYPMHNVSYELRVVKGA